MGLPWMGYSRGPGGAVGVCFEEPGPGGTTAGCQERGGSPL